MRDKMSLFVRFQNTQEHIPSGHPLKLKITRFISDTLDSELLKLSPRSDAP